MFVSAFSVRWLECPFHCCLIYMIIFYSSDFGPQR
ncbi:hypothetical protein FHX64_002815 [Microbacter margulisiae]|uniref:Uncharacterized protein n=1 Tax=Microbacter margulisiae TaxID=1350067 RepID=A0A7W5DT73_9PORP|nr:hypothetical protein [Microbacter margulisiae]